LNIIKIHFAKDENIKKDLLEKFFSQTLPETLKLFDERIGKSGSGFFAPSGLTWTDLIWFNTVEWVRILGDKRDAILDTYTNIKANEQKVRSIPNIAAWLAKRPKNDF
jgi:hypothetical protein